MTYDEISAAIQQYTENYEEDFVANIPLFVKQAEKRIFNRVLFPALRKNVTGTCTGDNKYLSCPTDFLAVSDIAVVDDDGAYNFLVPKDVSFIRQAYPTPTSTGLPEYYAIFGPRSDRETELTFLLGPTPITNYVVELHYFYYPTSIVDADTSWLGDNFDSVLLYGALVEAYIFMKGEADMMQVYEAKFQEAMMMAKRLGEGLERTDSFKSGEPRVPVA